jgi:hypothetical protein
MCNNFTRSDRMFVQSTMASVVFSYTSPFRAELERRVLCCKLASLLPDKEIGLFARVHFAQPTDDNRP